MVCMTVTRPWTNFNPSVRSTRTWWYGRVLARRGAVRNVLHAGAWRARRRCEGAAGNDALRLPPRSCLMRHIVAFLAASLFVAGCGDPVSPTRARTVLARQSFDTTPTAQSIFERYVALGTSNSMGVRSAGISAPGQQAAWPAQLAARAGAPFS